MRKFIPSNFIIILITIILLPLSRSKAQDSLIISGKGMYLWQLWSSNGGGKNLNSIITKLKSEGITWLVIKMADGDSYYNSPNHSLYNWVIPNYGSMDSVVSVFHANNIKLLAFQYVYGIPHRWGNPASETDVANSILDVKGIDGLLIDAEIEYDTLATRYTAAQAYCDSIHAHHPNALVGLTAWARITGHNTFPWTTFLDRVDVNMPQTYWAARPTSPQNELSLMSSQFSYYTQTWVSLGDTAADKPIMPIGQGEYFGYGSDVKQGDVASFYNLAEITYNYPGISLWEYNQISHSYVWSEYSTAWGVTSVENKPDIPLQYSLAQNYPNPFNPTTTISFEISHQSYITLKVYNVLGKEVATLLNGEKSAGKYNVEFNAGGLASGVYFYKLQAGSFVQTKKLILMK